MTDEAILVVDFGTGGTKCVLFDLAGDTLFRDVLPVDLRYSMGAADFDPSTAWAQICGQVRSAVKEAEKRRLKVVAVSSTSMREGNVFYDKEGKELLAVPNIDGRAMSEGGAISDGQGELIYEKSGHWPNAAFLVARLKWMEAKEPEMHSKLGKVSMINDWVLYRLSGVLACEPTNGCETAAFDLGKRTWSGEIAKELKLDESILPPVVECGTVLGEVTETAARATGLPQSASVVTGAADTESALAGCGALKPGKVVAVAGTTTPVQGVSDSLVLDSKQRTWTCCHVVPSTWNVESNAGATGMVFDWWSKVTGTPYDSLTAEARTVPAGAPEVTSLVGAMIFNARKFSMVHGELKGVFPWTGRGSVSKAIIEGTCLAVRANLLQVEEVLGRKFEELVFCGGAAESDYWAQTQADVLGRRVSRIRARSASAWGAAALCKVALGLSKDLESATESRESSMTEPRVKEAEAYDKKFSSWLAEVSPGAGNQGPTS